MIAAGLLEEWAKTTSPPPGEAPVEPYFSGMLDRGWDIEVVWRAHQPGPRERIWPGIAAAETVAVPADKLGESIAGLPLVKVSADQTTAETVVTDRQGRPVLRPGDTIIIPSTAGMLDSDGHWAAHCEAIAVDASIVGNGIIATPQAIAAIYADNLPDSVIVAATRLVDALDDPADEREDADKAVAELQTALASAGPPAATELEAAEWAEFVQSLSLRTADAVADGPARLEAPRPADSSRSDELDELSLTPVPATLAAHSGDTARVARRVAVAIGLHAGIVGIVERAALFHDTGKADPRFQAWLHPDGGTSEPMAKSSAPRSQWSQHRSESGWPAAGRHEQLSQRLVSAWLEQAEHGLGDSDQHLLVHLVASHHGHGRPLIAPADDRTAAGPVACDLAGRRVTADSDLSEADWTQPARFAALNRQYNPWGLALLEAVVRQADHIVSADGRTKADIR